MTRFNYKDGPRAVLTPEWIKYIEDVKKGSTAPHDCKNLVHPGLSCNRHNVIKYILTVKGTSKVLATIFLLPLVAKYWE